MIGLLLAGVAAVAIMIGVPSGTPARAQNAPMTNPPVRALGVVSKTPPGPVTAHPPVKQAEPEKPYGYAVFPQNMPHPTAGKPAGKAGGNPSPEAAQDVAMEQQAEDEGQGNFPSMERLAGNGQIQEAWDTSGPRAGVYQPRVCPGCVYKVRTREFMVTTLALPEGSAITHYDLGDPKGFQVNQKGLPGNMLAVRPAMGGLDTDLVVYTRDGSVYPFYVRSENFDSDHVPDLLVRLLGRRIEPAQTASAEAAGGADALPPMGPPAKKDFVQKIDFDPATLHGWNQYKLWGGDGSDELKPEIVYRDKVFTYLHYSKTAWLANNQPTAYVVQDGVDTLVNTRVEGTTFVIEAIAPLITLKYGHAFLCLQYTGDKP